MKDKIFTLLGKIVFFAVIAIVLYKGLQFVHNKIVPLPVIGKYLDIRPVNEDLKQQLGL